MGYGNESRQNEIFVAPTAADVLNVSGDAAVVWDVFQPITVLRVGALITVAVNATAGSTVDFDRRITTASDEDRVAKLDGTNASVVVPASTAAGKVVYKDVHVDLNPGDQIIPEVAAGACTGAGSARYFFEYVARHEVPANLGDMVESA